mmetsp:Transcript_12179/g.32789  ORF Transcript_12179/g.32789 Transcript_12179/m.32789 type:complete len:209 (+) Transcript_12179:212-838(+)
MRKDCTMSSACCASSLPISLSAAFFLLFSSSIRAIRTSSSIFRCRACMRAVKSRPNDLRRSVILASTCCIILRISMGSESSFNSTPFFASIFFSPFLLLLSFFLFSYPFFLPLPRLLPLPLPLPLLYCTLIHSGEGGYTTLVLPEYLGRVLTHSRQAYTYPAGKRPVRAHIFFLSLSCCLFLLHTFLSTFSHIVVMHSVGVETHACVR